MIFIAQPSKKWITAVGWNEASSSKTYLEVNCFANNFPTPHPKIVNFCVPIMFQKVAGSAVAGCSFREKTTQLTLYGRTRLRAGMHGLFLIRLLFGT
jgi:hypothetical protein